MKTQVIALIIVLIAIVGVVIGYFAIQQPPTTTTLPTTTTPSGCPATVPDKIVIGLSISLSGSYTLTGNQGLWGMSVAVKWVNDVYGGINLCGKKVKIELKYYDDQSSKDIVPSLYERLITVDRVDFLLGPYGSPLTLTAAPVAEKYNRLVVSWMANSDKLVQQGFRYLVIVPGMASTLWHSALAMVKASDPSAAVAIVYKEDEFNTMVARGAYNKSAELGLNVVFFRSYPTDIKDFTPLFTELAAAKPNVILVCSHEADGMLAAQQLSQLNINAKLIGIAVAASLPAFYDNFGTLAEGVIDGTHWTTYVKYSPSVAQSLGVEWIGPTMDEFLNMFKDVAGADKKPSYHAAAGTAGILALVKAIEKAQSLDQDAVRRAFNELNIMTVYGLFKIEPTTGRQIGHKLLVGQWQNGSFQIIWPPEAQSSKPVYPIPTWDEKRAGAIATP
ncbi:MAG: amino acid ABC transporter substrate-binding protein [Zestosphaera sp.]